MIVVGLTGKARSGKNAFAEGLLKTHKKMRPGVSQHVLAFADPLREMLYDLDPLVEWHTGGFADRLSALVDAWGWEVLKGTGYYPEVRRLMQRLGTDVMRKRDTDYWVNQLDIRLDKVVDDSSFRQWRDSLIVIPDVRFANEAEYVKEYVSGTVLLIDRPGVTTDAATEAHFSEALEGIRPDDIIINDGSLQELEDIAYVMMKILLRREENRIRLGLTTDWYDGGL